MTAQAHPAGLSSAEQTRLKLLDAAAELFATKGFRDVAVRDICGKAGANIAAINYHFGGKDNLHLAALDHARRRALAEEPYPAGPPAAGPLPPQDKLHRHVRGMLGRAFATGPASWYVNMVLREMVDPSPALAHAIDDNIGPHQRRLEGIVAQLMDREAEDREVRDLAAGITAMAVYYHACRAVITHTEPDRVFDQAEADRLTDLIVRFAVAGIEGLAR
ncbi:MAG: CerR family C-terminal domain-containing protein [Planctomycetota bacterium]